MSKKFKRLLVPEGYRHYWSKYPEGYTILEALLNWVESVNQLTDNVNDWNIYLDGFVETFDEELTSTVREMLNEMKTDGRLAEIINEEIFSWKADKTYVDIELYKKADKTYVDTELDKKADKTYVDSNLEMKANQDELNREKVRIDNLIANAGDTDGNAELLDIRVGWDGITYPTAGDAVRSIQQFMTTQNEEWVI